MRIGKKDYLLFTVFTVLTVSHFFPFLIGQNIFGFKDLSRYFYPLRQLMVEMARSGKLPLWNPYLFCGYPFLASLQIGFFYPLSIIYYILPFHLAFNYYTILHYCLASIFTYLLMRHYGTSRWGGFLSGLVFAFSGYLMSVANMNTTLSSVIWLPLVILFYDRLIQKIKWTNILFLSLVLALMFLGGEPTILFLTVLILAGYGIFFGKSSKGKIYNLSILLILLFIVALLTAVQLFPFLELALASDRAVLTDFKTVSAWSLPIRETINFVLPYFFGNNIKPGSYNEAFLGKAVQDWLISPYLGFIPLFFACFGFKKHIFWGVTLILGLFLSFGCYTPFYMLFYKFLPGVALIRFPVKFIFVTIFSTAVLAGFGFDSCFEKKGSKQKLVIVLWAFSLLFSLGYLFSRLFQEQLFAFLTASIPSQANEIFSQAIRGNFEFSLQSIFNLGGIVFLFGLILYMMETKKFSLTTAKISILAMVFIDLFSVNFSVNVPVNKNILLKATPNIELLCSDKSLFRYAITNQLNLHNRNLYGANYNQAILEAKDKFASNRPMSYKLYNFDGYESIVLDAHNKLEKNLGDCGLDQHLFGLGYLNVKYIISLYPLNSKHLQLLKQCNIYYCGETYVYLNKYFKPRAFLTPSLDGFDKQLPGRVEILEYSPQKVRISAEVEKAGYLFLSDTFFPGWRARLDRSETMIYKANYKFRAVKVTPGKHEIVFSYEPLSFKIGAIISSMTILGIIGFFVSLTIKTKS